MCIAISSHLRKVSHANHLLSFGNALQLISNFLCVTAVKVGKKLKSISKAQQVICVTHLAQEAAYGDTNFLIEKNVAKKSGTQMQEVAL